MDESAAQPLLDFTGYVRARTEDFTGREWVFQALSDWLAQSAGPRFFILTGEPGSGKTAIAARLSQFSAGTVRPPDGLPTLGPRFLSAVHFCRAQDRRLTDPRVFAESLSLQLARRHRDYALMLIARNRAPEIHFSVEQRAEQVDAGGQMIAFDIKRLDIGGQSPDDIFGRAVREPLEALFRQGFDGQVVILVDSLDEGLIYEGKVGIVPLLAQTATLPPGVRFILTSRPVREVLDRFPRSEVTECALSGGRGLVESLADIKRHVLHVLEAQPQLAAKLVEGLSPEDLAHAVRAKSEGNFLYVRTLLKFLETEPEPISTETLAAFPTGLDDTYRQFLTRLAGNDMSTWNDRHATVLGPLAVAKEALTEAHVAAFAGKPRGQVRPVLNELRQFLEVDDSLPASQRTYAIYHRSFSAFLLDEDRADQFWCEAQEQHQRIIDAYRGKGWEKIQWDQCDEYGLRYLVSHIQARLAMAQTPRDKAQPATALYAVVLNPAFRQAQREKLRGRSAGDMDPARFRSSAQAALARTLLGGASSLVISNAIHHSWAKTDEQGTQFAAVTAIMLSRLSDVTALDLWTTLQIALDRGDWAKALACVAAYRESNRRHRHTDAIFESVAAGDFNEALRLAAHYVNSREAPAGWAQVLFFYLAWQAAEAGEAERSRQTALTATRLPLGVPQRLSFALLVRVARTLTQGAGALDSARAWLRELGAADHLLTVFVPASPLDPEALADFQNRVTGLEKLLEEVMAEENTPIPKMIASAYQNFIAEQGFEGVLAHVAAEPFGRAAIDRALGRVLTEPEPEYRELGLAGLGVACAAAPDSAWARERLQTILRAALDWEEPTFAFDLPAVLLAEARRRTLPAPDLAASLERALASDDPWGTAMRARSATAAGLLRQGEVAAALQELEAAERLPPGSAPYATVHLLSLATRWLEFEQPDPIVALLDAAEGRARRVRDFHTRGKRVALVETYRAWLNQGVPDAQGAQATLAVLSDPASRGLYLDYVSARWAAPGNGPNRAGLEALVLLAVARALPLDAVLGRLIGLHLREFRDEEVVEAARGVAKGR